MVPAEPTTGPVVFPGLLEWVKIDHPANTPKQQFPNVYFGGVAYVYWMSKYEVTNAQYVQFLNAQAASDPLGLYDTNMGTSSYGGIAPAATRAPTVTARSMGARTCPWPSSRSSTQRGS